jgi:hypothetical protein
MDDAVATYQNAIMGGSKAPSHATVRALAQEQTVRKQATDLGEKIAKGLYDVRDANEVVEAFVQKLPPETAAAARGEAQKGAARHLVRLLGKQNGTEAEALITLMGSDAGKATVRFAFRDQAAFQQFAASARKTMLDAVRRAAQTGHPEAVKLEYSMDALSSLTPWGLAQALRGHGALAVAQALGSGERAAATALNKKAVPAFLRVASTKILDPETRRISEEARALFRELALMRERGPRVAGAPSTRNTAFRRGLANTMLGRYTGRDP